MTTSRLIDHLHRTPVVSIATRTRDGREILTPIWSVVVDGEAYIRNALGERSQWFGRARRNGEVAFADGPNRYPVELMPAEDTILDAVDAAYLRKYSGPSAREVVSEPARSHTLRVSDNSARRAPREVMS